MDPSQVTDLLSRAHTCLWEREGLLLSYHGLRGLSTTLRSGLKCGGLESKFRRDLEPLTGVERIGLACTWGASKACVFRGTQLAH
jgi:hypothetical protein